MANNARQPVATIELRLDMLEPSGQRAIPIAVSSAPS